MPRGWFFGGCAFLLEDSCDRKRAEPTRTRAQSRPTRSRSRSYPTIGWSACRHAVAATYTADRTLLGNTGEFLAIAPHFSMASGAQGEGLSGVALAGEVCLQQAQQYAKGSAQSFPASARALVWDEQDATAAIAEAIGGFVTRRTASGENARRAGICSALSETSTARPIRGNALTCGGSTRRNCGISCWYRLDHQELTIWTALPAT